MNEITTTFRLVLGKETLAISHDTRQNYVCKFLEGLGWFMALAVVIFLLVMWDLLYSTSPARGGSQILQLTGGQLISRSM